MPIYEFVCQSCHNEFEKIQSFSDPSAPACPNCNSVDVERQMGLPAIHFKGSGWYINDSKKATKESANGTSKNGADKETKTDSKSEGEGATSGVKESAGASASSRQMAQANPAASPAKAARRQPIRRRFAAGAALPVAQSPA